MLIFLWRIFERKAELVLWKRSPRTFSKPLYGTRPWCLVQAITRHTCQDPHLGSWNCLPHQAHIAPSEPMSKHRLTGFESRLVSDLPLPFIPTLIGLRAFDHVSSRVSWEAATNTQNWYYGDYLEKIPVMCWQRGWNNGDFKMIKEPP